MDYLQAIQSAAAYIEAHITQKINYEEVAKRAFTSTYHFQRVFGIVCGMTLGEYIRGRRLTVAGQELLSKKGKVIDVALRYGYETPESFSRAFFKFHGVLPSAVKKGARLKSLSPVSVTQNLINGGNKMNYRIEQKPQQILVGYKKRFTGMPYGEERVKQEEAFLKTTRAKQWLLIGASCDYTTDYMVITDVDDDGYDLFVAYELDEWTRTALFDPTVTGVDFMDGLGLETITIPQQTYIIFETEKKKRPIADYTALRKQIACDFLPSADFVFANAPEVVAMHWRPNGEWEKERYIEIRIPIQKA